VQNVQEKSPGASGTDHDSCREIEARLEEKRNDLYKAFVRVNSSMMDVDDNQADHRSEINALIEARKVTLSQQQRQKVERILSGPQDNSIVIDKFNIDMTRSKFACLRERTWLNDEVINFYMSMLQERDDRLCQEQPGRSSSHYFNSFFMSKLLEKGTYTFSNVRRWTKKFDVSSKDKIFLPVNISNTHWTLAVVYVRKKEIVYFDSMNGDGTRYLQALARWFREDVKDKKGVEVDTSEWALRNELNVPQQQNGFDCGVFAVTFADFLSDNLPLQFNQQEITENRLRFASSIIEGSLPY
jgi:sentrin-specific protease 1